MSVRIPPLALRHVALTVVPFEATEDFYVRVLGMQVEWRPDPDNVYLTLGTDNLALHRTTHAAVDPGRLDHIGFLVRQPDDVDRWAERIAGHGITLAAPPKTHRDGARSLYVNDPAGNLVQILFHPPISPRLDFL